MEPTLIISGISALVKAVDTWIKYRDSQRAAREFEARMAQAQADPALRQQAQLLATLVPKPILDTLGDRARGCWDKYHEVLKGGFLPREVDEATANLKACICQELKRMRDLNGSIPPGDLSEWWNAYCSV